MLRLSETGVCILSIDLVSDDVGSRSRQSQPSDARAAALCRQLAAAQAPATWGLKAAPGEQLQAALPQHRDCEVALCADRWAAEGASRGDFGRALADGLARLKTAGYCPTTVLLPKGRLALHDDLLRKHGISAVRVGESRLPPPRAGRWRPRLRSAPAAIAFQPLRWGLWEAVASVDLSQTGLRGVIRAVDRLSSRGGAAIVVAHVDMLTADDRVLSKLVSHLTRRREQDALRLDTLASVAARLRATPPISAARSILHSAAA